MWETKKRTAGSRPEKLNPRLWTKGTNNRLALPGEEPRRAPVAITEEASSCRGMAADARLFALMAP